MSSNGTRVQKENLIVPPVIRRLFFNNVNYSVLNLYGVLVLVYHKLVILMTFSRGY